jgi:hypothetical protein
MDSKALSVILRLGAGVLALLSLVVVVARLYGFIMVEPTSAAELFLQLLRIFFPLSVVLIFGYMAIRGKIPFLDR